MRLSILMCLLIISFVVAAQEMKPFVIHGKISSMPYKIEKIFIYYKVTNDVVQKSDSSDVVDGKYTLKGSINEPVESSIMIMMRDKDGNRPDWDMNRDMMILYLEPTDITLNTVASFENTKITGLTLHTEFKRYDEEKKRLLKESATTRAKILAALRQNDTLLARKINGNLEAVDNQYHTLITDMIKTRPVSSVSMGALKQYADYTTLENIEKISKIENFFTLLDDKAKNLPTGIGLKERISSAKATIIGAVTPHFSARDVSGKQVSPASFKGKYLLINFWASWCSQCRTDNRILSKTFDLFKNKGFAILGVSLDRQESKGSWLNAIAEDNLTWSEVNDFQSWNSPIVKQYAVPGILYNFLIDREGRIIAKNIKSKDMEAKLQELLK
jgi:peroxiredoxin